jgi:hypothetical protein
MNKLNRNLMSSVALMMLAAGGAEQATAMTFGVNDIVNNTIQLNFNAKDNLHYLNGSPISGSTFATTVDSTGGTQCVGGDGIIASSGNEGTSQSFVYSFILPAGYAISSLSVESRFTVFTGAGNNNHLRLFVSKDNDNWYEFATMTSLNNPPIGYLDSNPTTNLTASVSGATKYYIKGMFDFDGDGSTYPGTLQIFRTDYSGNANCVFENAIGVTAIPEPASLALLLGVGGLLAARRRR